MERTKIELMYEKSINYYHCFVVNCNYKVIFIRQSMIRQFFNSIIKKQTNIRTQGEEYTVKNSR